MNRRKGKILLLLMGTLFLALVLLPRKALSWGWGTHVYINDLLYERLGQRDGSFRANEIYGGMGVDFVNDLFEFPLERNYLEDKAHNEAIGVWDEARSVTAKALARGYMSHTESIRDGDGTGNPVGADYTAHRAGLTNPGGEGYIIGKARILAFILEPILSDAGIEVDPEVLLEISHEIVEAALDIALTQVDSSIGKKMIECAIRRSGAFPQLLARAYGEDFAREFDFNNREASAFIRNAERRFRASVVYYGTALTMDPLTAVGMLAEQKADVAMHYLLLYGIEVPRERLVLLAQLAISIALDHPVIVDVPEFLGEMSATIDYVEGNLIAEGIDY